MSKKKKIVNINANPPSTLDIEEFKLELAENKQEEKIQPDRYPDKYIELEKGPSS